MCAGVGGGVSKSHARRWRRFSVGPLVVVAVVVLLMAMAMAMMLLMMMMRVLPSW